MKKKGIFLITCLFVILVIGFAPAMVKAEEELDSMTVPENYTSETLTDPILMGTEKLIIKDVDPWGFYGPHTTEGVLIERGESFDIIPTAFLATWDLSNYRVIIIPSDQTMSSYFNLAAYRDKLFDFVYAGGVLVAHACDWGWNGGMWYTSFLPGEVSHVIDPWDWVEIAMPSHPIMTTPYIIKNEDLQNWYWSTHGYFTNLVPDTNVIIQDYIGNPIYIEYRWGAGLVIANMMTMEWYNSKYDLTRNEIDYAQAFRPRTLEKTLSSTEGELGDLVHVTLTITVPFEETVEVVDTLPEGFEYLKETFMINGIPAIPTEYKGEIICTLTESGTHVLEFDVKIDHAKNWEDIIVCNEVLARWYFNGELVDEKEDTACYIINPYENFNKDLWVCNGFADLTGVDIAYDQSHGERGYYDMSIIRSEIISRGATISIINTYPITPSVLENYEILWIDDWGRVPWLPSELNVIYQWVSDGGAILFHANELFSATVVSDMFGMYQSAGAYTSGYTNNIEEHWITTCIDEIFVPYRMSALEIYDPAYTIIYDAYDMPIVACAEVEDGRVVLIGDDLLYNAYIHWSQNDILANRAFDWLAYKDTAPLITEVGVETQWTVEIEITNSFDYMMQNVVISDRFGAEIEIDELPISITHGTTDYTTKGKSEKVFLTWDIGDLLPGETARLIFLVSTDLNPAGKQEYTKEGVYNLNSGSTLKFIDIDDIQLSVVTNSIKVTVLPS